jgi:hypothetical protein
LLKLHLTDGSITSCVAGDERRWVPDKQLCRYRHVKATFTQGRSRSVTTDSGSRELQSSVTLLDGRNVEGG